MWTKVLDALSAGGVIAGVFSSTVQSWIGHEITAHPIAATVAVALFAIAHRFAPSWFGTGSTTSA